MVGVKEWWSLARLAVSRSFEEISAVEDGAGHLVKANEHTYKSEQHTRSPSSASQEYLILRPREWRLWEDSLPTVPGQIEEVESTCSRFVRAFVWLWEHQQSNAGDLQVLLVKQMDNRQFARFPGFKGFDSAQMHI